ncbi:MAG: thioredoxin domain-containing protein [Actinomycetales bacterium]
MPNRLATSTSPYLLQHADNPVDWWEWGPQAFAAARERDLPIFLSIGYSACHWCHVMAHESFEDEATAQMLNAGFIAIKVDREERPDVDAIYMEATVALTGQGGWPMSVWLDHDARPFYAGTYFPPRPVHGMPAFQQVLQALGEAWQQRRGDITAAAGRITAALADRAEVTSFQGSPDEQTLALALQACQRDFDDMRGGFGSAPKFPPSMLLEFLLREAARVGDQQALRMAEVTLAAMARGGMYDQLGGGFARYSVDADWVVPHFEKMLYDNALLIRVYAHWWRLTGDPLAERVVRDSVEFLEREMRTPEGAFAAALDADSEGGEGLFYAWSPEQVTQILGPQDGPWACSLLEVTAQGTFEHGLSVLQLRQDPQDWSRWARIRAQLLAARAERPRPARDDKVVAAWNGLVIAALADAGGIFDEPHWIELADTAAAVLRRVHWDAQRGNLVRCSRDGVPGLSGGVLEDYADLAEGLLSLYQVTGDLNLLTWSGALLAQVRDRFTDEAGGFFDTPQDGEVLIRRPRDPADGAEPSGWLATAQAALTYAALTGDLQYRLLAERALAVVAELGPRAPRAVGTGLAAVGALVSGPLQVAIALGEGQSSGQLGRIAHLGTSPGLVVACGPADSMPLLVGRQPGDRGPVACVCRGFACDLPTSDPVILAKQVSARSLSG